MKPINHAERNSAFLNFLLLFLLSVATIMAVFFFSVKVPNKQNELMRERIAFMEQEKAYAASFSQVMQETLEELGKFDGSNEPEYVTKQRVHQKLAKMNRLASENPDQTNKLYDLIYQQMSDLNDTKAKIKRLETERGYLQN